MLHCAALTGNTQIVMMLLQCGADVMALTDVRALPFIPVAHACWWEAENA